MIAAKFAYKLTPRNAGDRIATFRLDCVRHVSRSVVGLGTGAGPNGIRAGEKYNRETMAARQVPCTGRGQWILDSPLSWI